MKKLIFYFCLLLSSIISVNAQTPNWQWAKSEGGTSSEVSTGVCTDASGNVFITGLFFSPTITFGTTTLTNAGSMDIFIVKYDATGNVLWAKSAGGVYGERGQSVCTDASGNVFITGHFYSPTIIVGTTTLTNTNQTTDSTSDIFIVKYDASGNVLWAKSEGGGSNESGQSVCTDASGNVFITGSFYSDNLYIGTTWLFKSEWDRYNDIFIVKYDTSGNVLWAKSAGGVGYDEGYAVCTDSTGNLFVTGTNSFTDIFIVKYDTSGNVLWAKSAGGTGSDVSSGVSIDASGNVIITGGFGSPSISFGTALLTNTKTTVNSMDIFIAKLGGITGINDIKNSNIKIYPNPTNNIINIEGLTKNENNTIQIFDVQGKLVITKTINEKGTIDLSELNKGVYVIKIGEVAQRIVKM